MKLDFSHPHFAEPAWLWLAVLAPVLLVLLQVHAGRARRRQLSRMAAPEFLTAMLQSHSPVRRWIKNAMLALAVFGMGLALARPQWGKQEEKSESLGEDVVFLLDCSASMESTDVKPTRLARAKLAIENFVQQYSRGRVGLVAFAGQAFLQCPLTFDYDAFRDALNAVDDQTIPVPGTDIGRALAEGYAAVEKNDRRKILVLVSDGEDLEKGSIARAKELAAKNVIIFTVGVGTPAGSEIVTTDARGNQTVLHDENGQIVVSRLDEATMRAIAEATHGTYQPLGSVGEGLTRVRLALENANGIRRFVSTRLGGVDHFHVPVALVLIFVVVESLLGTRRARPRHISHGTTLILTLAFLSLAPSLQAADEDDQTATPVLSSRELFNQGTAKLKAGQWRDAETSLDTAVTGNDITLQPPALYNLGYVRFRAGQQLLKGTPSANDLAKQSNPGMQAANSVIKDTDTAVAGNDIMDVLAVYLRGREANQNLKHLQTGVNNALETTDKVLARWMRSWGDFKSAVELKPDYANAKFNADIVDRNIAALQEERKRLQAMQQALAGMKKELQKALGKLKNKLPGGDPGSGGKDGDEDDGEGNQKPGPDGDGSENQSNSGQEMALTPEEAMRLLSTLHTDVSHKFSAGDTQEPPKKHTGRNW